MRTMREPHGQDTKEDMPRNHERTKKNWNFVASGHGALATLLIALSSPIAAQVDTLTLTVEQAIERGLDTSHRLAEAAARGDVAVAVAEERRALSMPQIAVQAGYTRTNHVEPFGVVSPSNQLRLIYPDVPDNYRSRVDVQWPLYNGGRFAALERAARREAGAASAELDAVRSDLRLEITRAYWTLVTAIESLDVVNQAVASIQAHLQVVRSQLDAGLIPPNDVLVVEAQESRQRMLSIQARVSRDVVEAELARLVGAPPGTKIQPASPLDRSGQPELSIESAIQAAREARADRRALVERVNAADEQGNAAIAGTRPTVGVGGGFDYARPNPRVFPREDVWRTAWDATVSMNWPIFDGGRTRAEIAEAAAAGRAVRARLDEFDSRLEVEVRQRTSELEAGRAAIAAAGDAVRAATEARRVAGERFGAGVATSTDVLDAQMALLQAELDRTQAIANARVAEARLARALGRSDH
jgi:outer membrane protein